MFTIMTQVMDIIEIFFQLRNYQYLRLDGSVSRRVVPSLLAPGARVNRHRRVQ